MVYNIFHIYDNETEFGDASPAEKCVATVEATEEEIEEFLKLWNKPRIYARPYEELMEHTVEARPVETKKLDEVIPYNPKTRDWPDLPEGVRSYATWNGSEWVNDFRTH